MKQHENYINEQLTRNLSADELRNLANFQAQRIAEFQHERLIHLLVTFFFAMLLFVSAGVFLWCSTFDNLLALLTGILTIILFTLEIFYIRHYYFLENGTQKLYRLTIAIERAAREKL